MKKEEFYFFVKNTVSPIEVAEFYLGNPEKISGDSYIYYSPLREKERTPSFSVNNEKRITRFWNRYTL